MILASQSPQRKKILKDLGIKFKAIPAHIDEHHCGFKAPHAIVKSIAQRKALAISNKYTNDWIIGCDTIVVLSNGEISVKPKNREDAKKTIKLYRNSYCDVYSGLAVINKSKKKKYVGYEKTRLVFSDFTDTQIEKYLDSGEWKDRSGSMTIEGGGGKWIKKVEGCYWNVVGLPIDLLKKIIKEAKIEI
ncbi:septum formation protein Maf [Candidatus Peregrinibacteria bacterium]|nr:septum formation protein Maf [Candidatus Peregrinibacteria bacterium]